MGIAINDVEDVSDEDKQQALDGEKLMREASNSANVIISPETVIKRGEQQPLNQVLESSQKNINVVKQIISQGGVSGPDKDKFDISQAHGEWIKSRNEYNSCPNKIIETSVRYTTLVNGKAGQNEILKAQQDRNTIKDTCDKSHDRVIETASKYIEIDRRVRENRIKDQNTYPTETFEQRGGNSNSNFGSVIEGFDFYDRDNTTISAASPSINQRFPRLTDTNKTSETNQTILPWNQYYKECDYNNELCKQANINKDTYLSSINNLFDTAEQKLKMYKNAIDLRFSPDSTKELTNILDYNNGAIVETAIKNQQKDIALYKQRALYDYEQYNNLSFVEDAFTFVYYAIFAIFVFLSLRDLFSSYKTYDKRNLIVIILLGIYPKYILNIILWALNGLTSITRMLGVKNISFWY